MPAMFGIRGKVGPALWSLCLLGTAAQAAGGLVVDTDGSPATASAWPNLQARVQWGPERDLVRSDTTGLLGGRAQWAQVLGDYYFTSDTGQPGLVPRGWRATSGLWLGPHGTAGRRDPAADALVVPYLGLGYSALSAWGLSLNADLGLVARQPGEGIRPGRGYAGQRQLDDLARDLQWLPILQLGVSYSF